MRVGGGREGVEDTRMVDCGPLSHLELLIAVLFILYGRIHKRTECEAAFCLLSAVVTRYETVRPVSVHTGFAVG